MKNFEFSFFLFLFLFDINTLTMEYLPTIQSRSQDQFADQYSRMFATYCFLHCSLILSQNEFSRLAANNHKRQRLATRMQAYECQLNDLPRGDPWTESEHIKVPLQVLRAEIIAISREPSTDSGMKLQKKVNCYFEVYTNLYGGLPEGLKTRYTKRAGLGPSEFLLPDPEVLKEKNRLLQTKPKGMKVNRSAWS